MGWRRQPVPREARHPCGAPKPCTQWFEAIETSESLEGISKETLNHWIEQHPIDLS